ncbi:histidine kinase [Glycomyces sp. A-F 0318]|uniref:sensor histidine kinase n=1 Tax=Glycomyces amatae TaxID=2881355 RepID=UPI001E397A35|nr:histidine kinase [Glycomyces amatae]MCD0447272.1 histidine kinase [Glycomyces amatae]
MGERVKSAARWSGAAVLVSLAAWEAFTASWAAAAPAAAAVLVLTWPRRPAPPSALAFCAAVSIAATAGYAGAVSNRAAAWWVAETALLLALVLSGSRSAGTRSGAAAVALAVLAVALSPLRLGLRMDPPSDPAELVVLALVWGALAAAAAAAGRYLRRQRGERERAVHEAQRAQRLALARDLHDYVAHDVTGMVVQAQAAQAVGEREPAQALAALTRIETAGLQALASLDRTVALLREHDALLRDPGADFADIAALARRFEEASGTRTGLDIDPALSGRRLADTTGTLAHRIVTEALTNVHRHAPAAAVRISLRGLPSSLSVEVVNDLAAEPPADGRGRDSGGHGIRQLAVTVAGLGGTFEAGPTGHGTWRLRAVLPL